MQNFRAPPCLRRLGALPPNPQPPAAGGFAPRPPLASGSWGLRPQIPPNSPPIANFWLRACLWDCSLLFATKTIRLVARNSQWVEAIFRRRPMGVWGLSPQRPEAGGLGAKPPPAGETGVWGRSPQRSKILQFFCKNNFILGLFWLQNNAFKTWLRNWQCKQD